MPCRPAEDDPSLNPNHGYKAANLLIMVCEKLQRDPPVWAYDIATQWHSNDPRPTVALCRLMQSLDLQQRELLTSMEGIARSKELEIWWKEHQDLDAVRQAKGNPR